jgi:hypothetical protein
MQTNNIELPLSRTFFNPTKFAEENTNMFYDHKFWKKHIKTLSNAPNFEKGVALEIP